jgi:predicted kinase
VIPVRVVHERGSVNEHLAAAFVGGLVATVVAMTGSDEWRQPTVVVVTGLPGTGKSTVADQLAQYVGAPAFSGDWLLGAVAPSGVLDHVDRAITMQVYEGLLESLFRRQLMLGQSAILDCRASDELVGKWCAIAAQLGGRLVTVECVCSDEQTHRSRIAGRQRNIPGWHEIDWARVEYMRLTTKPLTVSRLTIDAIAPVEDNLSSVLRYASSNH